LQANNNSRDGRHEFKVARPKKERNAEDEAEDDPVYFDEETGESLTKSEWEKKENGDSEGKGGEKVEGKADEGIDDGDGRKEIVKEKVAAIGGSRKRKAGKIVGGEEEEYLKGTETAKDGTLKSVGKKAEKGKGSKKGKKIMLSFGDGE